MAATSITCINQFVLVDVSIYSARVGSFGSGEEGWTIVAGTRVGDSRLDMGVVRVGDSVEGR